MATTFDPKCFELAEHFLSDDDESDLTLTQRQDRRWDLACTIQEAIETWMEDEALVPRKGTAQP